MALLSTRSKSSITDDVTADGDSCAAMKVLRLKPSGMATDRPLPLLGLGKSTAAQDPSPFLSSDGKISATSATMDSTLLHRNGKRTRTVTWSDEVTCETLGVNNDKRSKIAKVSSSRRGGADSPSSSTVAFPTTNDSNNSSDEENILTPSDNDPNKSSGRIPIKSALRNNNSMNKALLPAAAAATTIGSSSSMNSSKKKKAVSSTNESEVESSTGTVMTRNNDLPTLKKHSKRKHWTESEDNQLRQVVSEFTQANKRTSYARSFTTANAGSNSRTKSATNSIEWVKIAEKMGGDRSGKQCRERYLNHLQPGLNTGEFTPEEDALIERLVLRMGTKWTDISQLVPGRTDASVKNRWNYLQRHSSSKRKERKENKAENPSINPPPIVQLGKIVSLNVARHGLTYNAPKAKLYTIVHPKKAGGDEKVSITDNTDTLAHLFDASSAKEVEEDIAHSSMMEDRGSAKQEGTVSSESPKPKVGERVRVRFEDDDGESTFFEGTIVAVHDVSEDSSISSELLDMAMDIDRLANAVAAAAANPSRQAAHLGENMNSAAPQTTRIEIKYDDGTIEKNVLIDDPDIQILPSHLSEEETANNGELSDGQCSLHGKTGAGVSSNSLHNPDCVPLDTVRGLLLGKRDPIDFARLGCQQ